MAHFVLCEHPDLPGQPALMSHPRNGWQPVATENPAPSGAEDSPNAGASDTTQDEE
jgi:hypothetical protein